MSEHKDHGHKHMQEIIDGDHEASVKHRDAAPVHGVGGLLPNMAHGYEEASRAEAFKGGGKFSGKHTHAYKSGSHSHHSKHKK
jgi:hypothetical protein